jgi:hypothetical protein
MEAVDRKRTYHCKNWCFPSGIPSARVESAGPNCYSLTENINLFPSASMFGFAPTGGFFTVSVWYSGEGGST